MSHVNGTPRPDADSMAATMGVFSEAWDDGYARGVADTDARYTHAMSEFQRICGEYRAEITTLRNDVIGWKVLTWTVAVCSVVIMAALAWGVS